MLGESEDVTVVVAVDVKVVKRLGENVGDGVVGGDGDGVVGENVGVDDVGGDGDDVGEEDVGDGVVGGGGL